MNCKQQIKLMGTVIDIDIYDENACELTDKTIQMLYEYNSRFSANDVTSELMIVNQNAGVQPIRVHPELFELIEEGRYHSLLPFGNFDMTIGPIAKLWKIGFDGASIPSISAIERALSLVKSDCVVLNKRDMSVYLTEKGMEIDLGALAKGYIADKIMAFLKGHDVDSALINLGGNVLVYGNHPTRAGGWWHIGLQNPQDKRHQHLGMIPVKNQSVVTSGVYERFFIREGKRYHHIFNKKTGYPIETDMASLTIVAQTSLSCEIWTSQLFGLPITEAMTIINTLDDIEGIIVTNAHDILLSNGLKNLFIKL